MDAIQALHCSAVHKMQTGRIHQLTIRVAASRHLGILSHCPAPLITVARLGKILTILTHAELFKRCTTLQCNEQNADVTPELQKRANCANLLVVIFPRPVLSKSLAKFTLFCREFGNVVNHAFLVRIFLAEKFGWCYIFRFLQP